MYSALYPNKICFKYDFIDSKNKIEFQEAVLDQKFTVDL